MGSYVLRREPEGKAVPRDPTTGQQAYRKHASYPLGILRPAITVTTINWGVLSIRLHTGYFISTNTHTNNLWVTL